MYTLRSIQLHPPHLGEEELEDDMEEIEEEKGFHLLKSNGQLCSYHC